MGIPFCAETLCEIHYMRIKGERWGIQSYLNEKQRNVNLWASEHSSRNRIQIVGGFYLTNMPPRNFDAAEVYKWLDHFYTKKDDKVFRILRLNRDPRRGGIKIPDDAPWLIRPDELDDLRFAQGLRSFSPGHYTIVSTPFDKNDRLGSPYTEFSSSLEPVVLNHRFASGGESGKRKKKGRSQQTVQDTCIRDGGCVLSGSRALMRAKGYNFVGFNVAHIYPLGGVDQFKEAFKEPNHPVYTALGIKFEDDRNTIRERLDQVDNCIVLRSDLHSLMDQYQFAWRKFGDEWVMVRFEKDARPWNDDVNAYKIMTSVPLSRKAPKEFHELPEQVEVPIIAPPNEKLLEYHYLTAVSWHVAGAGRFSSTDAVLEQTKLTSLAR